jgi:CRP/FNR family cyclic AMP-dependent transcriptional regulator
MLLTLSDLPAVFPWATLLTAAQRDRVETDAVVRVARTGEYVMRVGTVVAEWLGMADGLVKLCVGDEHGRTTTHIALGPGGWWGDVALQRPQQPSLHDAVALRDSTIVGIPRPTFLWLQQSNAGFSQYLLRLMSERTLYLMSLLEADRLYAPTVRVARCLAALFNPWLQPGLGAQLDLSQEEIGNLAGVSRQRANEAVKALQQRGLVRLVYRGVEVVDVQGLHRFCSQTIAPRGQQAMRAMDVRVAI